MNKNQLWKLENNNIQCITNLGDCRDNIVLYGNNKGQCVKDCRNYINPYSKATFFFTLINCDRKNYCIPYDLCIKGKFTVYYHNSTCVRKGDCKVDVFNKTDPFDYDETDTLPTDTVAPTSLPTTDVPTEVPTETAAVTATDHSVPTDSTESPDDKRADINKRIKVIKLFTNEKDYTNWKSFDFSLIQDYLKLLKRESDNYVDSSIYVITTTKYNNFTITIFPLDIEEFVYDKILFSNNLIFPNFTKAFPNFLYYEIKRKCLVFVILLESNLHKYFRRIK